MSASSDNACLAESGSGRGDAPLLLGWKGGGSGARGGARMRQAGQGAGGWSLVRILCNYGRHSGGLVARRALGALYSTILQWLHLLWVQAPEKRVATAGV